MLTVLELMSSFNVERTRIYPVCTVSASNGGMPSLPGLTSIYCSTAVSISADGGNSLIDLSGLTSWVTTNPIITTPRARLPIQLLRVTNRRPSWTAA